MLGNTNSINNESSGPSGGGDTWGGDLRGDVVINNTFACAPYKCEYNAYITSFSAPNLEYGDLHYCFRSAKNLAQVSLPKFKRATSYSLDSAFSSSSIEFFELPELEYAESNSCSYLINYSKNLVEARLSKLRYIESDAFRDAFAGCINISDIYFNSLEDDSFINNRSDGVTGTQFESLLYNTGTTKVHTVHFPANMEETIANSLDNYPLLGGTSGFVVLAYDLPPTSGTLYFDSDYELKVEANGKILRDNKYYFGDLEVQYSAINDSLHIISSGNFVATDKKEDYHIDVDNNISEAKSITLATSISGLDVEFSIDGISTSAIADGNGNYSVNAIGIGLNIDYTIYGGDNYRDASGTITTTGENITLDITMEESVISDWTRPNLTDNGTLGGNSFAVDASEESYSAYRAVDGSSDRAWYGIGMLENDRFPLNIEFQDYTFYNPSALRVSKLALSWNSWNSNPANYIGYNIYASNDNTNWININSQLEIGGSIAIVTLTNSDFYKYYKIGFYRSADVSDRSCKINLSEIYITAQVKE